MPSELRASLGSLEDPADPPTAPPPPRNSLARTWALIASMVSRDLKVRHRGTFLGMLWSLTTPLLTVALYYFVFKFIFQIAPTKDAVRPDGVLVPFAVFFFCGLTVWNLFSTAVGASPQSIVGAAYLINKVYFPRSVIPLTTVLSSLVTFGFELAVLLVATLVFVGPPNVQILWVPVIVLVACGLVFGLGLLLSTLTVFVRDVAHFIGVALQLWFWGTPIIYSMDFVASRPDVVKVLQLNPMTGIVISFRNVVVLNRPPDFKLLGFDAVVAIVLVLVGAFVFQRYQRMFPEML